MADFDPYHKWLGIPPKDQPPNHYRLLAIELFESDADVIESAADQRMAHVRTFQTGQNSAVSQRILNELSAAKLSLLTPQKKADYDRHLREKMKAADSGVHATGPGAGRDDVAQARAVPVAPLAAPVPRAVPMPQATAMPVVEAMPVVHATPIITSDAGSSSVHRRRAHRKPLWQQPAVLALGTICMALAAVGGYYLTFGQLPSAVVATTTTNPATERASSQPDIIDPPPRDSVPSVRPDPPPVTSPNLQPEPSSTSPSPVEQPTEGDLAIIQATWSTPDKSLDVTEGIRRLLNDNRLMMIVWSDLFGVAEKDFPGGPKTLRISYRLRGKEYRAEYPNSYFVYLDGRPVATPTDSPDGFELLEARYGAGKTFVDVLPHVRKQVHDGRLSIQPNQFAAATAAELAKDGIHSGAYKVLWVQYCNSTGEHFDYAWNENPLVLDSKLPTPAGQPINLLQRLNMARDVVEGEWKLENGALYAPATPNARLQIPFDPPDEYMLTLTADAENDLRDISTILVVGGRQVLANVDGFNGIASGLSYVNGMAANTNPTNRWRCARMLEQGRPNTLVYIVRRNSVRVLRDGAELISWSGDSATLSMVDRWKVGNDRRLGLKSFDTPFRVTALELKPIAPEAAAVAVRESTAPRAGEPIDVLKQIDVNRDAVHGAWQLEDGKLVSPNEPSAKLLLPPAPAAEYQLTVVAERRQGNWGLNAVLVVDGHQTMASLDGYNGKYSGLEHLDGKNCHENESTHQGRVLTDGQPATIVYTVRRSGVEVTLDGKKIIDWHGDAKRLSMIPAWSLPDPTRLGLCTFSTICRISKIEIVPLESAPGIPAPSVASNAIDVLKQIDLKRDVQFGTWHLRNGTLIAEAVPNARLQVPVVPPEEYKLTMVAKGDPVTRDIALGLPVGDHQVLLSLDPGFGRPSALGVPNTPGTAATTIDRRVLADGESEIVCSIRRRSIDVSCNGSSVIHWTGDSARLGSDRNVPDPKHVYLFASTTPIHVSKFEIEPLSSSASPPPLADQPRKFSDLVANKGSRNPVPDDEALKKAKQEVQKKYGPRITSAKAPEQKRTLAQELAQKAASESNDDAKAYVLLTQAVDLAEAAGDLNLVWQTIDQLAQSFAVDGLAVRQQSLTDMGKTAKSPEMNWDLADGACRLMLLALAAGDAATVKKVTTQAQSFAKRSKNRDLQKMVASRVNDAGKLAAELDAVAEAREKLKTMPDDPQANFTVGHYELCASGDWDAALPKLAKCSDDGWKKLAADEQALANRRSTGPRVFVNGRLIVQSQPADAPREMALADACWMRADDEPWPGKHYLQMRAARFYSSALRSVVDLDRTRAIERLKLLLANDDGLPSWELFKRSFSQNNELSGEVVRLESGQIETAVEYGSSIDVTLLARTTANEIRLSSHRWGWGWNYTAEPNRWHVFHFVITPLSHSVFVDGVPLQTETSRTPRKLNSATVSIHANNNDVIEIKKFIVRAIE